VAVDKVVELEKERTEKARRAYQDWLAEKRTKQEAQAAKKVFDVFVLFTYQALGRTHHSFQYLSTVYFF